MATSKAIWWSLLAAVGVAAVCTLALALPARRTLGAEKSGRFGWWIAACALVSGAAVAALGAAASSTAHRALRRPLERFVKTLDDRADGGPLAVSGSDLGSGPGDLSAALERLAERLRRERERTGAERRALRERLDRAEGERDEALRRAADAERRLSEADQASQPAARSALLASVGHELRTPLNAVVGYSEMLEEDVEDGRYDDLLADARRIQEAAAHLLAVVDDALDLADTKAGKTPLLPERFSVAGLVAEVRATVAPLAQQNANALEVECAPDASDMWSDPTRIRQVLYNLLSNACKFTRGGRVRLDVWRPTAEGRVHFRVSDTGIGMAPEQVARLSGPLPPVDAFSGRRRGASGIGLPLSRHLCRMLGGDMTIQSRPGEGSSFTVSLPAAAPQQSSGSSHEPT